jgi:hypothetical protein
LAVRKAPSSVPEPVIARYRGTVRRLYFRGDAAFGAGDTIRLPANNEGKGVIKWTRLSCRTFAANAVRLQLRLAQQDRLPAEAPGRATAARGTALLRQP